MQLKMLSRNFPLIFYFSFEGQISSEKQDFRQQVQSCNIHIFILSRKKNIINFLHLVIFLSFYLADMFFYLVFFFEFILVCVAHDEATKSISTLADGMLVQEERGTAIPK